MLAFQTPQTGRRGKCAWSERCSRCFYMKRAVAREEFYWRIRWNYGLQPSCFLKTLPALGGKAHLVPRVHNTDTVGGLSFSFLPCGAAMGW